jgi:hypothetical protein
MDPPLGACQGRRPWVAVWFQECDLPVLVSLEMAAKSFVLRRCSNFYFSRPHNLFRGEEFAGRRRASLRYASLRSHGEPGQAG